METAKLFMNGRSQVVCLPQAYQFEGEKVYIRRIGSIVVLIPYNDPWQAMLDGIDHFTPDFMPERIQPELDGRKDLFA